MENTTHLKSAQAFKAHFDKLKVFSADWVKASYIWSAWINTPRSLSWKQFVQGVAA
jgi:hypothetical protein